jgi:hypothetical protein
MPLAVGLAQRQLAFAAPICIDGRNKNSHGP